MSSKGPPPPETSRDIVRAAPLQAQEQSHLCMVPCFLTAQPPRCPPSSHNAPSSPVAAVLRLRSAGPQGHPRIRGIFPEGERRGQGGDRADAGELQRKEGGREGREGRSQEGSPSWPEQRKPREHWENLDRCHIITRRPLSWCRVFFSPPAFLFPLRNRTF
jgi:hypothetical protein